MPKPMNKNQELMDSIRNELASQAEPPLPSPAEKPSILENRQVTANSRGKRQNKTFYLVPPESCRVWGQHDRNYQLLNETSCEDLIQGFRETGRQEFPAIVRELKDDPVYKYEVICGARRLWTATFLGYEFLIEIRDIDDEEAFRLSDIENRARSDISDYERAVKYHEALHRYYDANQKQMAARLNVSDVWLGRYLKIARLPAVIVEAYVDVRHLNKYHAKTYVDLLKHEAAGAAVLARAQEIKENPLPGDQVLKLLKAAAASKTSKRVPVTSYKAKGSRKTLVEVKRAGKGKVVVTVFSGTGAKWEELEAALATSLRGFL